MITDMFTVPFIGGVRDDNASLIMECTALTVSLARHPFGGWCCSKLRTPFRDLGFSSSRTLGGKVRLPVKPIHQDGAILWQIVLYPFYPFSVIATSHECWVYHAAFGLPTTQLPRSVTRDQSFSVAAQFGNHGNTQQSLYFFDWSVLPWLPHYVVRVLPCNVKWTHWNSDANEWYIALFTCKTTAHCIY